MAGNTIDVNIQPHILAAINANKDLVDAANSPGVKKADKKKILAKTDEVSGRISTIQDLIDKHAISSEQAIKEIEGVFNTLSKATVSLMSYSKAVKSELIRIDEEIQKKRDELQKTQDDYVNLKGNPNKIVYGGRQTDKDGNIIPGSEKSVEQYSLGKDDINTIVSQVAPDIGKPVNSKAALEKIASGEDSSVTDSKVIAEAADALNLVKAAQEQIRGILNDNLNLQVEINKAISEQQALSEKVNENANMTPGADQSALENLQIAYGNLQKQLDELEKKYKDLLASKSKENDNTNNQVEANDKLSDSYKKQDNVVNKAIKSFFGYQQIIRALRTVINFTVKTITDLDKALTDQAIVSDLNRKQAWALVGAYSNLAKQTGFTTTEIAQTASKFLQQGRSVNDTMQLTKAAAESARVAGISASQAVDYLTTALNGFGMKASQALEVSDKFAALAASSATSYDELATALSKVASQASLAGMSMDYTLALLAKGVETTRESAESIGTALKTVIARMREITDYGATLEDGTDINNVEKQLSQVGIALRDNNGELRSTQAVLNEVGLKWDTLSKNQQAAIAKALAGTRQQSRLISMMSNYQRTLELVQISEDSLGATEAQQAEYMGSMAAATNNVQVAWQSLITTITNADSIIGIVNYFATTIDTIAKNIWLLIPAIVTAVVWTYNLGKAELLSNANKITRIILTETEIKDLHLKTDAEIAAALAQKKVDEADKLSVASKLLLILLSKKHIIVLNKETEAAIRSSLAIKNIPLIGWILAAITALVALGVAIYNVGKQFGWWKTSTERTVDSMKKLTAEAYNFKKTASEFDSVVNAFDDVDSKVIKTTKDLESLKDTASKAKELLSNMNSKDRLNNWQKFWGQEDKNAEMLKKVFGTDDKNKIQTMIDNASNAELAAWSKQMADLNRESAKSNYQQNLRDVAKNPSVLNTQEGLSLAKNSMSSLGYFDISAKAKEKGLSSAQSANINTAWSQLMSTLSKEDIEKIGVNNLEQFSKDFAESMSNISEDLTATFFDDSKSLEERGQAFEEIIKQLPPEQARYFKEAYGNFADLMSNYSSSVKNHILNDLNISIDALNKYNSEMEKLGLGSQADEVLSFAGELVKEGKNYDEIVAAIIKKYPQMAEHAKEIAGYIINASDASKTLLGVTQDVAQLSNTSKSLRDTQSKWGTMSAAEKSGYIAQHPEFFKNAEARKAFENGSDITSYLKSAYGEKKEDLSQEYDRQIQKAQERISVADDKIKNAKSDVERKAAEKEKAAAEEDLREAKEDKNELDSIFDISLDDIVKKQQSQISTYKNFLKQQQSDLIDSLNARKQAYQDYFDAINAAYDEQNFASEEQRIQEQIVKFSTGTDATSQNKVLELTNKLSELQKNHSEEQRKKSQEAVLNNIDDEISKINDYYDKVLNNDKEMLALMNQWLAGGKSRDEYEAYLTKLGYTNEEKEQSLKTFDTLYADGKGAGTWMNDPENTKATEENTTELKKSNQLASTMQQLQVARWASEMVDSTGKAAEIKTDAKTGDTIVNFAGQTYNLSQADGDQMSKMLLQMLKNARFATKV